MLDNPKDNFTIGINDDVTNLSLETSDYNIKNSKEMLIYGYGSDIASLQQDNMSQ